jgi:hypothetical protein
MATNITLHANTVYNSEFSYYDTTGATAFFSDVTSPTGGQVTVLTSGGSTDFAANDYLRITYAIRGVTHTRTCQIARVASEPRYTVTLTTALCIPNSHNAAVTSILATQVSRTPTTSGTINLRCHENSTGIVIQVWPAYAHANVSLTTYCSGVEVTNAALFATVTLENASQTVGSGSLSIRNVNIVSTRAPSPTVVFGNHNVAWSPATPIPAHYDPTHTATNGFFNCVFVAGGVVVDTAGPAPCTFSHCSFTQSNLGRTDFHLTTQGLGAFVMGAYNSFHIQSQCSGWQLIGDGSYTVIATHPTVFVSPTSAASVANTGVAIIDRGLTSTPSTLDFTHLTLGDQNGGAAITYRTGFYWNNYATVHHGVPITRVFASSVGYFVVNYAYATYADRAHVYWQRDHLGQVFVSDRNGDISATVARECTIALGNPVDVTHTAAAYVLAGQLAITHHEFTPRADLGNYFNADTLATGRYGVLAGSSAWTHAVDQAAVCTAAWQVNVSADLNMANDPPTLNNPSFFFGNATGQITFTFCAYGNSANPVPSPLVVSSAATDRFRGGVPPFIYELQDGKDLHFTDAKLTAGSDRDLVVGAHPWFFQTDTGEMSYDYPIYPGPYACGLMDSDGVVDPSNPQPWVFDVYVSHPLINFQGTTDHSFRIANVNGVQTTRDGLGGRTWAATVPPTISSITLMKDPVSDTLLDPDTPCPLNFFLVRSNEINGDHGEAASLVHHLREAKHELQYIMVQYPMSNAYYNDPQSTYTIGLPSSTFVMDGETTADSYNYADFDFQVSVATVGWDRSRNAGAGGRVPQVVNFSTGRETIDFYYYPTWWDRHNDTHRMEGVTFTQCDLTDGSPNRLAQNVYVRACIYNLPCRHVNEWCNDTLTLTCQWPSAHASPTEEVVIAATALEVRMKISLALMIGHQTDPYSTLHMVAHNNTSRGWTLKKDTPTPVTLRLNANAPCGGVRAGVSVTTRDPCSQPPLSGVAGDHATTFEHTFEPGARQTSLVMDVPELHKIYPSDTYTVTYNGVDVGGEDVIVDKPRFEAMFTEEHVRAIDFYVAGAAHGSIVQEDVWEFAVETDVYTVTPTLGSYRLPIYVRATSIPYWKTDHRASGVAVEFSFWEHGTEHCVDSGVAIYTVARGGSPTTAPYTVDINSRTYNAATPQFYPQFRNVDPAVAGVDVWASIHVDPSHNDYHMAECLWIHVAYVDIRPRDESEGYSQS